MKEGLHAKRQGQEDLSSLREMLALMVEKALVIADLPHRYHLTELEFDPLEPVSTDLRRLSGTARMIDERVEASHIPLQALFKVSENARVPRGLRLFFPEGELWFAFPDATRCRLFEPSRIKRANKATKPTKRRSA